MTVPTLLTATLALAIACEGRVCAAEWTQPVEVTHDQRRCISYRARLAGRFLIVEAAPAPGWHTFAMDNTKRAEEKLAGRKSLGTELPTELVVTGGLQIQGSWFQSPPKDFSQPELRWYSWGFDSPALFAAKVGRGGTGPARVAVRGQVCTGETCKNVDISILIPLDGPHAGLPSTDPDISTLVRVR